jgi:phosphoribosyl 1,2-cyclic phosphodiesterase
MKIRFWGTRGSIPTPGPLTVRYGGNTACVEVRRGTEILIFDAGTGIRALGLSLLREFPGRPLTVHLFVSHTHWDHIQGFPFFAPANSRSTTIHVYGAPGQGHSLEKVLRGQMDADYFPVGLRDLAATIYVQEMRGREIQVGDLRVGAFYLNHPGMTLGYRVTSADRRFVYATDHEPYAETLSHVGGRGDEGRAYGARLDAALVDFVGGADLYVGDAQFSDEEYGARIGWGHSSVGATVAIGLAAQAKALALFHHDPLHDDRAMEGMQRAAREMIAVRGASMQCFAAAEGQTLTL